MKKILLASAFALLATGPAFAQADGDDDFLLLTGAVDYNCDATLVGQSTQTVSVREGGTQTVGRIRYTCNDEQGFNVTVSSVNGTGRLQSADELYSRNYTLSQGPGEVSELAFSEEELDPSVARSAVGFQAEAADDDGSIHDLVATIEDEDGQEIPGDVILSDQIRFLINGIG